MSLTNHINEQRKEILIYTFGLEKKEVMNMKMEDLKRKIHELWPKLVTDNN